MYSRKSAAAWKIIRGGEKGDLIKEKAKRHYKLIELPKAEKEMNDALENWPEKK